MLLLLLLLLRLLLLFRLGADIGRFFFSAFLKNEELGVGYTGGERRLASAEPVAVSQIQLIPIVISYLLLTNDFAIESRKNRRQW